MKSQPLVSIIVPTYNCGKYLRNLCESVLNQTYRNYELLIGDDGSNDNTMEILDRYSGENGITVFRWESNAGVHHRTYELLLEARGEYWAYPGADDILEPTFIERRVECMESHRDVVLAHGPGTYIDSKGQRLLGEYQDKIFPKVGERLKGIISGERSLEMLIQHNFINTPGVMIRMSSTRQILPFYSPAWWWLVDWHLWILLASLNQGFYFDPEPLHRYTVHEQSNSNNPKRITTRLVEGRLVPLLSLALAAQFSIPARRIWSKYRIQLYSKWLLRAWKLRRLNALENWMIEAAAIATFGSIGKRVSFPCEVIKNLRHILQTQLKEKIAIKKQLFHVSGIAQVSDSAFST